jgi:hypothetical protein
MNSSIEMMYLVFSSRDIIAQAAFTYCFGYVCGFSTAAILVIYFLSEAKVTSDGLDNVSNFRRRNVLKEDQPNDESRKILDDAVRHLVNIQAGRIDVQLNEEEVHNELPSMSLYQLEQYFQESCNASRDRAKHLKSLASFIIDISKTYASFGKDLSKLSLIARSFIKPPEAATSDNHADSKGDYIDKASHVNDWWIALSTSLEHLSGDNEKLSEQMSQEVASQITQAHDEQNSEDKLLVNEGLRILTQLKDSLMSNEPLVQERDKWRVKVTGSYR